MLKIALDLDDTIFIWRQTHEKKFNCKLRRMKPEKVTAQVHSLRKDKEFWSNLPLLERPDFSPCVWATKRENAKSYTIACLKKYNLPVKPIIQFYNQSDNKAEGLRGIADILIDDSWFNVQQCINSGFPALLITRPHNKWVKTPYRVSHLNYKEIEDRYNDLFR